MMKDYIAPTLLVGVMAAGCAAPEAPMDPVKVEYNEVQLTGTSTLITDTVFIPLENRMDYAKEDHLTFLLTGKGPSAPSTPSVKDAHIDRLGKTDSGKTDSDYHGKAADPASSEDDKPENRAPKFSIYDHELEGEVGEDIFIPRPRYTDEVAAMVKIKYAIFDAGDNRVGKSHIFTPDKAGSYKVKFTATDTHGLSADYIVVLTVNPRAPGPEAPADAPKVDPEFPVLESVVENLTVKVGVTVERSHLKIQARDDETKPGDMFVNYDAFTDVALETAAAGFELKNMDEGFVFNESGEYFVSVNVEDDDSNASNRKVIKVTVVDK